MQREWITICLGALRISQGWPLHCPPPCVWSLLWIPAWQAYINICGLGAYLKHNLDRIRVPLRFLRTLETRSIVEQRPREPQLLGVSWWRRRSDWLHFDGHLTNGGGWFVCGCGWGEGGPRQTSNFERWEIVSSANARRRTRGCWRWMTDRIGIWDWSIATRSPEIPKFSQTNIIPRDATRRNLILKCIKHTHTHDHCQLMILLNFINYTFNRPKLNSKSKSISFSFENRNRVVERDSRLVSFGFGGLGIGRLGFWILVKAKKREGKGGAVERLPLFHM